MKRIHEKVNIIPVIGKADACTHREVDLFKAKILVQLEINEIRIYDFPESELRTENNWMRSLLPFAVVGSNTTITTEDGTKFRGREYPWGVVNIGTRGIVTSPPSDISYWQHTCRILRKLLTLRIMKILGGKS